MGDLVYVLRRAHRAGTLVQWAIEEEEVVDKNGVVQVDDGNAGEVARQDFHGSSANESVDDSVDQQNPLHEGSTVDSVDADDDLAAVCAVRILKENLCEKELLSFRMRTQENVHMKRNMTTTPRMTPNILKKPRMALQRYQDSAQPLAGRSPLPCSFGQRLLFTSVHSTPIDRQQDQPYRRPCDGQRETSVDQNSNFDDSDERFITDNLNDSTTAAGFEGDFEEAPQGYVDIRRPATELTNGMQFVSDERLNRSARTFFHNHDVAVAPMLREHLRAPRPLTPFQSDVLHAVGGLVLLCNEQKRELRRLRTEMADMKKTVYRKSAAAEGINKVFTFSKAGFNGLSAVTLQLDRHCAAVDLVAEGKAYRCKAHLQPFQQLAHFTKYIFHKVFQAEACRYSGSFTSRNFAVVPDDVQQQLKGLLYVVCGIRVPVTEGQFGAVETATSKTTALDGFFYTQLTEFLSRSRRGTGNDVGCPAQRDDNDVP